MALGALQAINDLGFRCPDDISLTSVDDVPWANVIQPRITTVVQPVEELATVAANWMIESASTREVAPPCRRASMWGCRDSSSAPPARHRAEARSTRCIQLNTGAPASR